MPQQEPFTSVFELEQKLEASWSNIRAASAETRRFHQLLEAAVQSFTGEDTSIVLFGSGGRFEMTPGSDPDWTYLIDGQAKAKHQDTALKANAVIKQLAGKGPGSEGIFGALAFSHDLLQYIGGQNDTNANLTRRILLLIESKPIGRRDAHGRVVRAVLDRYLSNDQGWIHGRTAYGIPRFLFNDICRYWRTVTVDYAYKQWTRDAKGWALRNAKLRMSRKLTYAAGLLYCFELAHKNRDVSISSPKPERKLEAIERLSALTDSTPLDVLAKAFLLSDTLNEPAKSVFQAYDRFLGLLSDKNMRDHLNELSLEAANTDEQFQEVRDLGIAFQSGLNALFLKPNSTRYPVLIEEYGVF